MVQPQCKKGLPVFLTKLTIILFLGICPKEIKTYVHQKTCTKMVIVAYSEHHKPEIAHQRINKMWYKN